MSVFDKTESKADLLARGIVTRAACLMDDILQGQAVAVYEDHTYTPGEHGYELADGTKFSHIADEQIEVADCEIYNKIDHDAFNRYFREHVGKICRKLISHLHENPGLQIVMVNLECPGGVEWSDRALGNRCSVRLVRGYDIHTNRKVTRLTVLYGLQKIPVIGQQ